LITFELARINKFELVEKLLHENLKRIIKRELLDHKKKNKK